MEGETLADKKLLVCGGAGFMGSSFIHAALKEFPNLRILNLDLLTYAGDLKNLEGVDESRHEFVKGDIVDQALVKDLMSKVNVVLNFAAETHVDRSIHSSADAFIRTNVLGVHSLLEALKGSPNVEKMVHISTDEVWGDLPLDSKDRFTENSPFLPNSPYVASKAAGDLLIRSYIKTHNAPVIVRHSVNNYGPRQFPEKLIPFFTMRALEDKPLPLYGSGENQRDWLHVDDHSAAILAVLRVGRVGEVYNVSQQKEYSNKEIAERILQALGKPASLITYVEDRPGHDLKYAVDSSKLRALGWTPRYSLEEKLPEVVQSLKEHLSISEAPVTNTHINI